jgi:DNA anti-recombination protein RmuC
MSDSNWDGGERRQEPMRYAQLVGKLEVFMNTSQQLTESLKSELDSKLTTVSSKLSSIEEKLTIQVERLSKDIDQSSEKTGILMDSHKEHNSKEHKQLVLITEALKKETETKYNQLESGLKAIRSSQSQKNTELKNYVDEYLDKINTKITELDKAVGDIVAEPGKRKAKIVDDLGSFIKKGLFSSITILVVGFLGFMIYGYIKTL